MGDRVCRAVIALITIVGLAAPVEAQRARLDAASRNAWAALLAVHDVRGTDTVVVDRALTSTVAPLRAAAARVIGMNRIVSRYAALRALLQTERDSAVVRDAAFALGLASDTGSCDALRDALVSPVTATAAAWALGELGAACGDFATLLQRTTRPQVRAALLRVAGKWIPFPDTVVSRAFQAATDSSQRWAALYALARARRPAGATLALDASRSSSAALREVAARLMPIALQPAGDSLRMVARLDTLLRDRAAHVRIAAVRSLATYRTLARAPLDAAWMHERDANVRVAMAQAIGNVVNDTSGLWRRWWHADTTHMVRRSLIASAWQAEAIAALDDEAASLSTSPDFRIRIAMIEGAASAGVDRFASRIVLRLDDADGRVRAAAVAALGRASATVRDSIGWPTRFAAALQDADEGVRTAALASRRRGDPMENVTPLAHGQLAPAVRDTADVYARVVREIIAPSLAGRAPALLIETDRGTIRIALDGVLAPMTSDHLLRLAGAGYFRNLRFHRVVPAFVAQGGDPRGDGSGGPGYAIRDELNRSAYRRGAVGMALSGPDTGGSQFFLTLAPSPHLDGHYTVFGHVLSGTAAMDALVQGDALRSIRPVAP